MNHFGGGGFGGPGLGSTTMMNPYFDFGGAFMAQQVRVVNGMVAYSPANFDEKKRNEKDEKDRAAFWPFQGPMRAFTHSPPYGYMGPLPYNFRDAGR